jgi:methylglutaconyl-CoA hydratase
MADPILYEVRGPEKSRAAWITLNTPENHNALSLALCQSLDAAIDRALGEAGVRAIVLTGVGKTFCAGADLKSGGGGAARPGGSGGRGPFVSALHKLWECPKPVLGRIQGNAWGGGVGLMAACDIAIAVDSGRYGFTEVRLGLIPAIISVFVLRKLAPGDASRYFLSGDRFTAAQARQMGLVQEAVPEAELDAAVQRILDSFAQCGPRALAECKALLRKIPALDVDAGLRHAEATIAALFASEEGREGMAAFAEKRKARWVP